MHSLSACEVCGEISISGPTRTATEGDIRGRRIAKEARASERQAAGYGNGGKASLPVGTSSPRGIHMYMVPDGDRTTTTMAPQDREGRGQPT